MSWRGAATVLGVVLPALAFGAPKAQLWERWAAHDPLSKLGIDHGAWDGFLRRYVVRGADGVNRVRYATVTPQDRALLQDYLAAMQRVRSARYRRSEQFAYWINLYNAMTVEVVLRHYPVESIRDIDISPGLFSRGPWGAKLLEVDGERLSLDDIEHRILRPLMRDPRVHYAVNCASIGCPNLQPRAFSGARLDEMLDAAAREYVNHPRGARIRDGELVVSSIYDWFQADFGGSERAVIAHLRQYAEPRLARLLAEFDEIDDYQYDWSLNDARD